MNQNLSKPLKTSFFLSIFILFSAFSVKTSASRTSIFDAIKNKQIDASIMSNGKYNGNSVDLKITNILNQSIEIVVPAGTTYSTSDDSEQTLIQLEEIVIALQPKQTFTGHAAAFCTEASDRCPTSSSKMSIAKSTNPKFTELSEYIKGKSIDKSTFQDAVWAISDGHSVSNIAATDKVAEDFRKKVSDITGQKNPWFNSPQHVTIDEQGNINMETVLIAGQLEFVCEKGTMVHQDIYKANGEPVLISDKTMQAKYGNVRYRFQMQVKGWEKGEYYIKLHDGNQEITRYEFSV